MGSRRTLRAEELSRDVESLAADDNDLLAAQQLLGNDTGETTQKVALAVNDDLVDTQRVSNLFLQVMLCSIHVQWRPCPFVIQCLMRVVVGWSISVLLFFHRCICWSSIARCIEMFCIVIAFLHDPRRPPFSIEADRLLDFLLLLLLFKIDDAFGRRRAMGRDREYRW